MLNHHLRSPHLGKAATCRRKQFTEKRDKESFYNDTTMTMDQVTNIRFIPWVVVVVGSEYVHTIVTHIYVKRWRKGGTKLETGEGTNVQRGKLFAAC